MSLLQLFCNNISLILILGGTTMKKVYCLYRVSTDQQVEKNDIPMQREACHKFADEKGWCIEKEFYEKGVSGFKVSANDRDAIQDLKRAAVSREFDILLVFMFDRLGRRDDETPFVVEWFVRNGVAVWSVNEGEQRFDNHIDKLLNYIQFWQASGESIKTSIRTKTRIEQLTKEEIYTGGTTPYGYRLVLNGRVNRQGREVHNLEVDPVSGTVVQLIYQKYVEEGMGTHRIARFLTENGVNSTQGNIWTSGSISRILKNKIYTGVIKKGSAISECIPSLRLIDDLLFERAQIQRQAYLEKQSLVRRPWQNINTLCLLGLAYCGHCGRRLIRGTSGKSYSHIDGTKSYQTRERYICANHQGYMHCCDGPAGFSKRRLQETVFDEIQNQLNKIQGEEYIACYQEQIRQRIQKIREAQDKSARLTEKLQKNIEDLNMEMIRALNDESLLSIPIIRGAIECVQGKIKDENESIVAQEQQIMNFEKRNRELERLLRNIEPYMESLYSEKRENVVEALAAIVQRIDVISTSEVLITYCYSIG